MGSGKSKPLEVISGPISLDKFLGAWRVHCVLPTPFERGAYNPVEVYSLTAKRNELDVKFTYNKGSLNGKQQSLGQKLFFDGNSGHWAVAPTFMPILKLSYEVLLIGGSTKSNDDDADDKYTYIVVGHPSRRYFWIMGRDVTMDDETMNMCKKIVQDNGFDLSKAVYPKHQV